MEASPYSAPLLALAAHIDHQPDTALQAVVQLPFFQQFTTPAPSQQTSVELHLAHMNGAAGVLGIMGADQPATTLLRLAAHSVEQGLRGMLMGIGCPDMSMATLLKEAGRLVVKNAFPRPLACYAAGAVGDFSVHRLPLAIGEASPASDSAQHTTQAELAEALRHARTQHAIAERTALPTVLSQPELKWSDAQWQGLTWRLGYTSVFTLLLSAGQQAACDVSAAPASAELHAALLTIVRYCQQVFNAYLADGLAFRATGEAFQVPPQSLAA